MISHIPSFTEAEFNLKSGWCIDAPSAYTVQPENHTSENSITTVNNSIRRESKLLSSTKIEFDFCGLFMAKR
jgi:hypothetical protein